MISVKDIAFRYPCGKQALRQVSFDLEAGNFLAILGNNGTRKSTLLQCLNRILKAERGSFHMNGEDILCMHHRDIARRIAFLAQSIPNMQMTVQDMVMLGRKPFMRFVFTEQDQRIVDETLAMLDLEELRGRYLNELSGGERQKIALARALAQQPKLLLLDEPTSSLDIKNQYQVLKIARDFCRQPGKSAIVVMHDINLALRFCDRFLLLRQGEVYRYGDHNCLDAQAVRDVYQVNGRLVQIADRSMLYVEHAECI